MESTSNTIAVKRHPLFAQHVLPTGFMKIGGGVSLACALRDGFKGRLVLYEPGHAALHAHVGRHARARRLRRELQSGSKDVKIVEKTRSHRALNAA